MDELAREMITLKPADPRRAQIVQDNAAQRSTEAELMPEPAEVCRANQQDCTFRFESREDQRD
jgi:hypothetical protein